MRFDSILFPRAADCAAAEPPAEPAFFVDLNLDQIVAAVTAGKDEYDLKPFFCMPLRDADAIAFRHEVMRDLEDAQLFAGIKAFADQMRAMRQHLAQTERLRYRRQKERWFLDAVDLYCGAVAALGESLSRARLASRGLLAFQDHLNEYASSEYFTGLVEETKRLKASLSAIHYSLLIKGTMVEVRKSEGETDYSAEIEATFERFKQRTVKEHAFAFLDDAEMNHVEAMILDGVVMLYPETFSAIESYCQRYKDFLDPTIARFDREIQFYVAWLDHIARLKQAGLSFCYPRLSQTSKEVHSQQGFDLALAHKLIGERRIPVCNDFYLTGRERIIVVSGPNQGGKTTFARTFGQLHYLARLGCPVPGAKARLFLFDRLFTHFERQEDMANLRGKLEDDLFRVHKILESATPRSILILNEIFTSTTFRDARVLSQRIAARIMRLDLLCVWVTFIDELASLSDKTVSMMSTVVPDNPAVRTFRIVRRPADGLAYALSIAEKYRLTYDKLKERLGP